MKNELYELYKQCFPTSQLSKEHFLEEIDYENSNIIMTQEHCQMIGASVVDKNSVRLLCIQPEMQGKGYGKKLLKRTEESIIDEGYEAVVLYKSNCLFGGKKAEELEKVQFFTHHNYQLVENDIAIWGEKKLIQ